jgi:hypothetical protein
LVEANALKNAGLARVSNYQPRQAFVPTFADNGVAAATQAHEDAVACGMPPTRPIYFSVDGDTSQFMATRWQAVDEFFREVNSQISVQRTGAYGSKHTIDHLSSLGLIAWKWQTSSWSQGAWADVHMRQYNHNISMCSGSVDFNQAMKVDYGQW